MNEINIVENKELREKMAGRVEVLNKVKELLLLPQLEMMPMQQVADYYEVDYKTVHTCYLRNKEEINSDGAAKIPVKSMASQFLQNEEIEVSVVNHAYEFKFSDEYTLRVPNVGIILFPKRAILRIGMLLRDSEVAKEVRTQLLNIAENSSDEVKTFDIDKEMSMYTDLGKAFAIGSKEDMMLTMQEIVQYHCRHIDTLTADNKMFAADILRWDNRKSINKAVRVIANHSKKYIGSIWNELYDELYYKHGISLKQRGEAPYIRYVNKEEWPLVQQSLSAICEKYEISPSYVMEKAKLEETA